MVSFHKGILLLVLEYSLVVFCEGYSVQWDECSYDNFKKELRDSCKKFKRDGEPMGEGSRAVPWSDHQEPYEFPKGFEDMDFYKEIMDNRPVHPSIHGPRTVHPQGYNNNNRLGAQHPGPVPVPQRLVERRRPPPQHQQQFQQQQQHHHHQQYQQQQQQQQQKRSYTSNPYDTNSIPEALETDEQIRERMLRFAYMSFFAKCCARNCKSEDFYRFCP